MNDFRTDLGDELSMLSAPPLGDIVGAAARDGRRTRRVRGFGAAVGSALALTAVVALAGGALGSTGQHTAELSAAAGPAAPVSAPGSAPVPAPASPSTTPVTSPAPAAGLVPTNGKVVLAAVLKALPAGVKTSNYAVDNAGKIGRTVHQDMAQTYVTTAAGTGMVRVFLSPAVPGEKASPCKAPDQCFKDAKGEQVYVSHVADNPVQNTLVTVAHADGSSVMVQLSSVLAWNGTTNPAGIVALTVDQAAAVASDPALSTNVDPAAVAAAAAQFPSVPLLGN
ncbi:hypothetical protein P3T36_001824 [Kitasatospora sp. MAP12-15]|uniref:hypothetical protein n=1 Tax=unclassified Kitasatospora TaxID=2633591 RepID=UPI0024752D55|nr:hypothetical protein [Kitasatospora sp. MAP12-44]MDH6113292.1 hypothetical protein [Kitasatospora sp. MAP12-44]